MNVNASRVASIMGLLCLVVQTGELLASDLQSVDRTIGEQPTYRGEPLYAMAVFGKTAATKMWLVVDRTSAQGDVLYIDLNGDGELTDPAERVESQAGSSTSRFTVPVLVDPGGTKHTDFSLRLSQGAKPTHMLSLKWRGVHKIGGGYPVDPTSGYMQFAKTPEEAPIVWFNGDGPFRFQPWYNEPMRIGADNDLKLFLGQVGVGPNSFCAFQRHVLPKGEGVIATLIYTDENGKQREATSNLNLRC